MKEHPILFSGEMVRAILDGRKAQTRRVIKPQPPKGIIRYERTSTLISIPKGYEKVYREWMGVLEDGAMTGHRDCPYGQPGDRLWVRETTWMLNGQFQNPYFRGCQHPLYCATDAEPKNIGLGVEWIKRPSIHMPRWASRITLEVMDVRVERMLEITYQDAIAEGINRPEWMYQIETEPKQQESIIKQFCDLWDSINTKRGYGWETNPYVWVIEFKVLP